jgi:hypothetical protein
MTRREYINAKLLIAQIGPRENRAKSRALLLSAKELPGTGWIEQVNIVVRMGVLKRPSYDWSARAGNAGHFYAYRLHRQEPTRSQISLQAFPLLSEEDALLGLSELDSSTFLDNPDFHGSILADREVPPIGTYEIASSRAFLTSYEADGRVGHMRSVHFVDGPVLLAARFLSEVEPWSDQEMLNILDLQRTKLDT